MTGSWDSPLQGEPSRWGLICAPSYFPALWQGLASWSPPWFEAFRPGPNLPPLAEKRTAGSCGLSTMMMVDLSQDAGTVVFPAMGNHPYFSLEGACIAYANPRSVRLPAFSRPLSRCSPLSSHPPRQRLWCADGSSRARRTICVLSLHR